MRMVYQVNPNSLGFMRYPYDCADNVHWRVNIDAQTFWTPLGSGDVPLTLVKIDTDHDNQPDADVDAADAAASIWSRPFPKNESDPTSHGSPRRIVNVICSPMLTSISRGNRLSDPSDDLIAAREDRDYLERHVGLRFENPKCLLIIGHDWSEAQMRAVRQKESVNLSIAVLRWTSWPRRQHKFWSLMRTASLPDSRSALTGLTGPTGTFPTQAS